MYRSLRVAAPLLCIAILSCDRPRYSGPIRKAAWKVPHVYAEEPLVIHEGILYARAQAFSEEKPRLYAFDVKTGKTLWASDFVPKEIKFVAGPMLLVTDENGDAHSLELKTGKVLVPPEPTTLVSTTFENGILYAVAQDGAVTARDTLRHVLWSRTVPLNVFSKPVVTGGNLYVSGSRTENQIKFGSAIYAFDPASGSLRWQWKTKHSPISELSADASAVYLSLQVSVTNGLVLALDATTGKEKWSHRTQKYFAEGPLIFDARTLVARDLPQRTAHPSRANTGHVFRGLSRATGETLWESTTQWKYDRWVAHDGLLFASEQKSHSLLNEGSTDCWLTVVDLRSGHELWRSETVGFGRFTTPAVGDGMVVAGSSPSGENAEGAGLWAWPSSK